MSNEALPDRFSSHLEAAFRHISETLYFRLKPLARSRSQGDQYECINAVVYLISSAASLHQVSRESRLRTFTEGRWLERSCQSHESMVEAGFYYLNEADHVKCFFCDLGLRDWNPSDSPELEHAKFSPLCFFLKASRGLDWLRSQTSRPPNYPPSYLRQDHNELMRLMKLEMDSPYAMAACGIGFNDTVVLLCIARRFIRQRAKLQLSELISELQSEMDKEMLPRGSSRDGPQFPNEFDLAGALRAFRV